MNKSDLLEESKKQIRSILITFQKGCSLREFLKSYRDFIGCRLPTRELGFKSEIDFLYSIPDVVRIYETGNDYHLFGIADEKSKHIQNMVFKQKPAKSKMSLRNRFFEYYVAPPRLRSSEPHKSTFKSESYNNERKSKSTAVSSSSVSNTVVSNTVVTSTTNHVTSSPKEEILSLVKKYKDGLFINDILLKYEEMYNKTFSHEQYGFESLEECIECISELDLVAVDDQLLVCPSDIVKDIIGGRGKTEDYTQYKEKSSHNPRIIGQNISSKGCIPESMNKKLQMVAEAIPKGILASEFPKYYEDLFNTPFDLHDLGYNSLADFIDDASDIFVRKPVHGSQRDYIIYPIDEYRCKSNDRDNSNVDKTPEVGAPLISKIIYNIRTILEANMEGIKLQEFLHVYSINCKDSLRVKDMGFNDIETFLLNIKDRVPLRFEMFNGMKYIHLLKRNGSSAPPEVLQQEAVPHDAEALDFQFQQQSLPPEAFNTNPDEIKYFPVYVSSVANPNHLYIQLQEMAEDFGKMADNLDHFYNGYNSKQYLMKNVHIKIGASCVALWPVDQHWYRAQILSIPSMETVQVSYVDYGTRETIPKSLIRYMTKKFSKFPAQAIRCSLACLQLPKNCTKWDPKVKKRILQMVENIELMAKVIDTMPDGVFSIILCDTNEEKDKFINDELHKEGLADYIVEDTAQEIPQSPEIVTQPESSNFSPSPAPSSVQPPVYNLSPLQVSVQPEYLNPLQALQAQYFLQAFAAVAPSFAKNENYLKLLRQVSMYCLNPDPLWSSQSILSSPGMPNTNAFASGMNAFTNPYAMQNNFTSTANLYGVGASSNPMSAAFSNSIAPPQPTSQKQSLPSTYSDTYSVLKPSPDSNAEVKNNESDIFDDDDDDDMFQKFCQQKCSNVRHVKRVYLGDGYKIHIVVVDSKPYVSSGDISQLIWNNKAADYLSKRLQSKEVDFLPINLSEDGNEECFHQLERLNVKGVQKTSGFKPSILLYPLKVVIKILNLFGHPSISLRVKLSEEIAKFDLNDPVWSEFSIHDTLDAEEDENLLGATDDDKIERLCLFDLLAMKEGINCKRLKMMKTLNDSNKSSKNVDELEKLEQLQGKVLQRIQEIREICKLYS